MPAKYASHRLIFDLATQGDGRGSAQLLRGNFTATNATNMLTMTAHNLSDGDKIRLAGSDLPDGLVADLDYFVIKSDADDFQVALTELLRIAGTAVTFADDGSGTRTVTSLPPNNHPLFVKAIELVSGATGGAIEIHDGLGGALVVDEPSGFGTNAKSQWDINSWVSALYVTTLPATCSAIVTLR